MCAGNCTGCNECSEKLYTSDVAFDGEFNNIVVPEGSDLNDVLLLIETYIDEQSADFSNLAITFASTCIGLAAGTYTYAQVLIAINTTICEMKTNITDIEESIDEIVQPFKYIKEFTSVFDADTIEISQVELTSGGDLPLGTINGSLPQEFCDLQISVYFLFEGAWYQMPIATGAGGANVSIDDTTGLISITLNVAPSDPAVRVRVVIIG